MITLKRQLQSWGPWSIVHDNRVLKSTELSPASGQVKKMWYINTQWNTILSLKRERLSFMMTWMESEKRNAKTQKDKWMLPFKCRLWDDWLQRNKIECWLQKVRGWSDWGIHGQRYKPSIRQNMCLLLRYITQYHIIMYMDKSLTPECSGHSK